MKARHIKPLLLLTSLLIVSGVMFFQSSPLNAAFGTSPPWVKNDHMLPGTTYEETINLSRSDADQAVRANIQITGDEKLKEWITIPNQDNLVMKAGQGFLPMKVIVEVPERAELRNYKGGIFITMQKVVADDLGGGQVGIALGGNVSVDITVTGTRIVDYKVLSISNSPISEGNPLSIKVKTQNLGNVSIDQVEGQVEVYDKTQSVKLKTLDFLPLDDSIAPDETNITRMFFEDTILDPGEYWLFVKATKDDEVIYENRIQQEITKAVIPVVTPEDAMAKDLPKLPGEGEVETETEEVLPITEDGVVEVPVVEVRPAVAEKDDNSIFLIFGLAGLGFGFLAVMGVIIALIFVLKNQQKPAAIMYQVPPAQPVQSVLPTPAAPAPAPAPPAPAPTPTPPAPAPTQDISTENAKIETDANKQG